MGIWIGVAAVCMNKDQEVLMVYQGKPEEIKKWSVPSGGLESGETIEECCIREVFEETGYHIEVVNKIGVKNNGVAEVHYFFAKVTGGQMSIHDPDELIHDIGWKDVNLMPQCDFAYPEDIEFLRNYVKEVRT